MMLWSSDIFKKRLVVHNTYALRAVRQGLSMFISTRIVDCIYGGQVIIDPG